MIHQDASSTMNLLGWSFYCTPNGRCWGTQPLNPKPLHNVKREVDRNACSANRRGPLLNDGDDVAQLIVAVKYCN